MRCPTSAAEMPDPIYARAKLPWWPSQVTFTWEDGWVDYRKLSARPPVGSCEFEMIEYDDAVFGDRIRGD